MKHQIDGLEAGLGRCFLLLDAGPAASGVISGRAPGVTGLFDPRAPTSEEGEPFASAACRHDERIAGRSSAWLERQLWELDVAGSNPGAPTHVS
jgi:hypothetical protein